MPDDPVSVAMRALQDTQYVGNLDYESRGRRIIADIEAAGWKIVGRVPPEEMLAAGSSAGDCRVSLVGLIWRAMYAAAPRHAKESRDG